MERTLDQQGPSPSGGKHGSGSLRIARATGPNAGSIKYDMLTALGVYACAQDAGKQRLILRFITLVVARYNWTTDRLTVGQREIAAMWSIDERSVKREMSKLRNLGFLEQVRPAARGRVAEYALGIGSILAATQSDWKRVGPDFDARLTGGEPVPAQVSNIVSFPGTAAGQGVWTRIQTLLHGQDPHLFRAWFAAVTGDEPQDGVLHLTAPSRFHATYLASNHAERILRLAANFDANVQRVIVKAPG
jgi:hypothetical protein